MEEQKVSEQFNKLLLEAKEKGDKVELKKLTASKKKSLKKLANKKDEQEDVEGILYFPVPQKINGLSNITYIDSGATYNYAIGKRVKQLVEDKMPVDTPNTSQKNDESAPNDESMPEKEKSEEKKEEIKVPEAKPKEEIDENLNVAYSWGIGNSYVLATKEEDTEYTPYEIKQDMYKGLNPLTVS